MKTVKIYSTPNCKYCVMAKDFFKEKDISYTEYDVKSDQDKKKEMIDASGQMGVPVIIVGDSDVVVGFNKPKLIELLDIK